jgi:hypothetical protein
MFVYEQMMETYRNSYKNKYNYWVHMQFLSMVFKQDMWIIIDTNIWPSLIGLFTVLLSSWYIHTHLPSCHTLKYKSTSCLSYNECSNPAPNDLHNYFHAHFWLTAKKKNTCWLTWLLQASLSVQALEIFFKGHTSWPWYPKCTKIKTAWKRLSQSHRIVLWPFIIPMSQTWLVNNGLHEVVDIVIIIIFLY